MKFVVEFFDKQNRTLSSLYGDGSAVQVRASNFCNLLLGFGLVVVLLLTYALLINYSTITPKRLIYSGILTGMFVIFSACYFATLKGYFRPARIVFMAQAYLYIVPAVMLTGGIPQSDTMYMLPLPILYAFALFEGRKSMMISMMTLVVIAMIAVVPAVFNIELPDFSKDDMSEGRELVNFSILFALTVFTLFSLQFESQRAIDKARHAARVKSEFLANMSHEIRTPMNGVLGLTDVLMSKPMPPDQKKMLKVIDASGNALLNIINDILDFSKLDAGKIELDPRPFDLKDVLRDIHSLFETKAHEKGLYFRFKYPASCPTRFVGDQGRLRQILLNLVGNALKFTDTGGVVVVARMNTEHHLQIEIHDTGVGIETEKMEHLFGLFTQAESSTTRKYGGTGLGLAISRRLARAMGGDITVQSQLGDGAVFSVSLPLPEETSLKLAS